MKKLSKLLLFYVCIVFCSCGHKENHIKIIDQIGLNKNKDTVDFSYLFPFKWDTLYVFQEMFHQKYIKEIANVDIGKTEVWSQMFIFKNKGTLVYMYDYNNKIDFHHYSKGDFIYSDLCFSIQEAKFWIYRDKQGGYSFVSFLAREKGLRLRNKTVKSW